MSAKLTAYVTVVDENGDVRRFGPDDEVPAEFAKRITNPDVWDTPPAEARKAELDEPKADTKAEDTKAEDTKAKAPQRRSS